MINIRIRPLALMISAFMVFSSQTMAESNDLTTQQSAKNQPVQIHWGYEGHEGPEHWGELSTEYTECQSGVNQSPVDISMALESDLPVLVGQYQPGGHEVVNNGHSIQVNYDGDSEITIDGKQYQLKQFHFHHPSENAINGQSFPLEVHLVHQSSDGKLAVVAVMFELGDENPTLQSIWSQLPKKMDGTHPLKELVNIANIMPKNALADYYRFSGSLTTPPCSEGVIWIVAKDYGTVTQAEVDQFDATLKHHNNRPIQPLNSRKVLQ